MKRTRIHATSLLGLTIVLPFILSVSSARGALCAGDDFDDNIKDKSSWGAPINPGAAGNQLVESNGRLEFKGSGFAAWPWVCRQLSYTQDWSVTVDVHVGDVVLPQGEPWAQVSLVVGNANDPNKRFGWVGDFVALNFEYGRTWDGTLKRAFNGDLQTNWVSVDLDDIGVPDEGPATGEHGSAKISFSASDKTLTMWCDPDGPTNGFNWIAFCSLRVDASGYGWGMNDSSTFRVGLVGDCDGVTINSGDEVWMDNFSVEPAPSSDTLGVNVVGKGKVLPDLNGTLLQIGETYKVAAKPQLGFKFAGWSGSVEGAELFSTNSSKLSFVMQSNLLLTATFVDVLKPTLKITAPSRRQSWSNAVFTVRGTAKDNGWIAGVRYQLNGGGWLEAVTANGGSNWTAEVTLQPGINLLQAYAIDAADNVSRTNSASINYIELLTLADYYPMPLGAEWLYEGVDWDGNPAKMSEVISSTNFVITNYFGSSPVVAYPTSCVVSARAYLSPDMMEVRETWEEFLAIGGRVGFFGDDDHPDESLRVAGGLVFPERMAVGSSATVVADAYNYGQRMGKIGITLNLLNRTAVTVPAGTFSDVIHLRWTFRVAGQSTSHEEMWARSVGKIKRISVPGGRAVSYELINSSLLPLMDN